MKKTTLAILALITVLISGFIAVSKGNNTSADEEVTFPDKNLEAALRTALNIP